MSNITIIALFGKSASGKDTIQKWITKNYDINSIVSCTTRPKRERELEGVDYFYRNEKEFTEMVLKGEMLEATDFRGWFYGTPLWALRQDKINVGVFNITGIETLLDDSRLKVIPIYIEASDKVRLLRSLNREENPDCGEICRRFDTDRKDFQYIEFDYLTFENNGITLNEESLRAFLDNILK